VLGAFRQAGLAESRVRFVGWQPLRDYLETYRAIDVALDPFPYAGGTTTCDALWMGVPVVSLAGATAVSRAGSTLLTNAGLPELVARSEAEYLELAAGLLRDGGRLATLRAQLRGRLERSPVMDAPGFTRGLEAAYRAMWREWCAAGS
jgi:predicted O-linked N-acetylglucosamine transferase (SPINDLY family)